MTEAEALLEAKRMIRDKLAEHPDAGVRLINEIADIPDDHPGVAEIAAAIRKRKR